MKYESERFLSGSEIAVDEVGDGIKRQIMGHNDDIMIVKVWFEAGSEGYQHKHRHSQSTYIESGIFDVTISGETRRQGAGDCYYIAPRELHGAVCVQAGVLIDVFSPVREDFLTKGDDS